VPDRGRRLRPRGQGEPDWQDLLGDSPDVAHPAAAPGEHHATRSRPRSGTPRRSGWSRLWRDVREVGATVFVALAIAVVVKTFLVQPFFIPSESMESTLLVGDRVLVSKLEPGPGTLERGDVVVFVDPGGWLPPATTEPGTVVQALTFVGLLPANSGEHLIKRVIGLPGDTVECCDEDGRLLVNGEPVDEPYLFAGDVPSTIEFSVEVPQDRLWVQGDHRAVSEDSRYQLGQPGGGMVPMDNVVGRAVLVMWPFDRFGTLPTPEGVFDEVGGLDGVR
jgi:signal peptidase I